jgi:hypothetical protein
MEPQDKETQGEARVGQLIAAAGPGQTASPAARQRVYAAVRAHWEATAGPRAAAARQERAATRRRFSRLRTLGIAAGLSAAAVLIYSIQGVSPETGEAGRFAQLLRIEGGAVLLRAGTTVPLGS